MLLETEKHSGRAKSPQNAVELPAHPVPAAASTNQHRLWQNEWSRRAFMSFIPISISCSFVLLSELGKNNEYKLNTFIHIYTASK